jgi:hypothetical protein
LVFINILWRAEILGLAVKPVICKTQVNPYSETIFKQDLERFPNSVTQRMSYNPPQSKCTHLLYADMHKLTEGETSEIFSE